MTILFVGAGEAQSKFRQAMERGQVNSVSELAPNEFRTLSQQYDWLVMEVKSLGVGRDAAPSNLSELPMMACCDTKVRRNSTIAGLQFEYERAEIISYHQPRQK
ncbi:MAG: hypothetical protein OEW58_08750 [Gammaproteobacteria bacterium]|nr:hypothetical protein [Gammaproteobacteria bacterium]